ncbi:hypothetical protein RV10_GL001636 [Enterococcus pallens]|nr:hypothetical protein RV10_GL001636 [Enterococcus pallens]
MVLSGHQPYRLDAYQSNRYALVQTASIQRLRKLFLMIQKAQ